MIVRIMLAAMLVSASVKASEPRPTGSPSAPDYQPIGKDEQGLWAEDAETERKIKVSKLLIRDPLVTDYLHRVLCRSVGSRECTKIRIYLLRVPLSNASMSSSGIMSIYSGILLRVRDEAELSAIMGHEFVHFENRHNLASMRKMRSAASWGAWLTVASALSGQAHNFTPEFLASYYAYGRDQEREADLSGLSRMSKAGYRPMAASAVWLRMREEKDAQAGALGVKSLKDKDYGPFASHPMDVERMTYLARQGQALEAGSADFDGVDEYRAALAPIWPMLIDDQIKLNDFGGSEYLLANLAAGVWTGPLLYARAELYRTRGGAADLLTAETLYRQAVVQADAPNSTWRGLGLVLLRNGRRDEGKAMLQKYLLLEPNAADHPLLQAMANGN